MCGKSLHNLIVVIFNICVALLMVLLEVSQNLYCIEKYSLI